MYVINSLAIAIVPAAGNPVVLTTVTAVPDPPVPAVSAFYEPFKVVVAAP